MRYYTNILRLGKNLCVRGIEDGKVFKDRIEYCPTVYIETDKETPYKTIFGGNLRPINFDNMEECLDFCQQQKETNLKLYGFPHHYHTYILENYQNTEKHWNKDDLRIHNIDIEVYSDEGFPEAREANYPITAICIHDSKMDKFLVFGLGQWSKEKSELSEELTENTYYIPCKDEHDLINRFVRYWQDFPPDIVTGWNIELFDMPYIHNRMQRLGFDVKRLSPWRNIRVADVHTARGTEQKTIIGGIAQLDYITMYKKQKVRDSYRLDNIASIELGEKKLDYSEVAGLHNLYKENFQKYIDYNIQDVNLVKRLDEKLGLIEAQVAMAYMACLNYDDIASPVKTWDALINKELSKDNIQGHYHVPQSGEHKSIAGGYVKEPQLGKNGWCVSFDLASLYPHLIMQFNISPETLDRSHQCFFGKTSEAKVQSMLNREKHDAPEHLTVAASGYCFNNTFEGIIPKVMKEMYLERKQMKAKMIEKQQRGEDYAFEELRQYVLKIGLNSGYGALANKYYRWFDNSLAESITLSGQLAIQNSERAINEWMNKLLKTDKDYVIAIDTDSNYVNVQPLVDKFFSDKSRDEIVSILDKICQDQIEKAIKESYDDLAEYAQCRENAMKMDREAIASSAFWTAKKRYAMAVWDMEGVRFNDEPKIKIQGLEAIRSSTPAACREPLLEMIRIALLSDETNLQQYVANFKNKFMSMPVEDISMPRTMNNITKQTRKDETFNKGTPPHVRGAIVFNRLLEKHNLKNWERMKNGEKGKFVYLYKQNNVGTDVISFSTSIPDEFDCKKYVDKNKMFEKVILDPLQGILDQIGWTAEKQSTLTDFFS